MFYYFTLGVWTGFILGFVTLGVMIGIQESIKFNKKKKEEKDKEIAIVRLAVLRGFKLDVKK